MKKEGFCRALRNLLFLMVFGLLCAGGTSIGSMAVHAMKEANIKPEIVIYSIDGKQYRPTDFQENCLVLVYGRTGCYNTRTTIEKAESLRKEGCSVRVVLMDIDQVDDGMAAYAKENPMVVVAHQYPLYNNQLFSLGKTAGVITSNSIALPGTYIMNKGRTIVYASIGLETQNLERAVREVSAVGTVESETQPETGRQTESETQPQTGRQTESETQPQTGGSGTSAGSGTGAGTGNTESLSAPVPGAATNLTGGIKFSWTQVNGASGYIVYRKTGNGKWVKAATLANGMTTSYTDKSVKSKNGTIYSYTVKAYRGTEISSFDGTGRKVVRLTTPGISSLKNKASKKMTVSWKKNSKASGYQIQYAVNKNFQNARTSTAGKNSILSKTLTKLTKKKTYYVRIRSYKKASGITSYSSWSSVKKLKITK